jgi:hypothetical protein
MYQPLRTTVKRVPTPAEVEQIARQRREEERARRIQRAFDHILFCASAPWDVVGIVTIGTVR